MHDTDRETSVRARVFGLLAALLLATAFIACGGDDEEDAEATSDGSGPDAAAILNDAATRMQQVASFHFELEHENGSTTIVRGIDMEAAVGDFVAPDQMQATVEGSLASVNFDLGVVVIGEDGWLQNPLSRRWEREDISIDDVFDPQEGVQALLRSAQSPEVVGREDVRGVETYRVEATLDSGDLTLLPGDPEPGRPVEAIAWVGVDDRLVHRVELHGAVNDDEDADLVRRLNLSRFDESVTIEPPD